MIHNLYQLETKDYARMRDLILKNKDGASVAKSIREKRKAIARFVAGNILCGGNLGLIKSFYSKKGNFTNAKAAGVFFEHFGNRALELGVKMEDIEIAYQRASIPKSFDTAGLPVSDSSLKNAYMERALSLTGVLKEIDPNALFKEGFSI